MCSTKRCWVSSKRIDFTANSPCLLFIAALTGGSFHQRKVETGAAAENTGGGGLSSLTRLLTLIGAARRRADQDQITGRPRDMPAVGFRAARCWSSPQAASPRMLPPQQALALLATA